MEALEGPAGDDSDWSSRLRSLTIDVSDDEATIDEMKREQAQTVSTRTKDRAIDNQVQVRRQVPSSDVKGTRVELLLTRVSGLVKVCAQSTPTKVV